MGQTGVKGTEERFRPRKRVDDTYLIMIEVLTLIATKNFNEQPIKGT